MKDLKKFLKLTLLLAIGFSISTTTNAQCNTWKDLEKGSPEKETAETNYQIYKDQFKAKNYEAAFVAWDKMMAIAPAADGKRISTFWRGITILKALNKKETDAAKKKERNERIIALHKQCIECLEAKKISPKSARTPEGLKATIAEQLARQADDMFKLTKSPSTEIYPIAKQAVEMGGKDISYKVMHPYASSVVEMFKAKSVTADETRKVHDLLIEIAEENTIKQEEIADKFAEEGNAKKEKRARDISNLYTKYKIRMKREFKKVETDIFDCNYFKELMMPDYEEGKDDLAVLKTTYVKLKKRGCEDTDPFIAELKTRYSTMAKEINANKQAEFDKNNPAFVAKQRYDVGDFTIAIEKYQEAIAGTSDAEKQAKYHFRIASIQGRKLKQFSQARTSARKAAQLKPNWGRPFMLIGDLYATSSRRCGDDWNQRLAVLAAIEKYSYAKSIDASVADEANSRIGKYNKARPDVSEGFSRGVESGSKATVGCWIGESVTVKFK